MDNKISGSFSLENCFFLNLFKNIHNYEKIMYSSVPSYQWIGERAKRWNLLRIREVQHHLLVFSQQHTSKFWTLCKMLKPTHTLKSVVPIHSSSGNILRISVKQLVDWWCLLVGFFWLCGGFYFHFVFHFF